MILISLNYSAVLMLPDMCAFGFELIVEVCVELLGTVLDIVFGEFWCERLYESR